MALFDGADRRLLEAVSNLVYSNPFLPDILANEREALGSDFVDEGPIWSMAVNDPDRVRANTWRIMDRLQRLLTQVRERLIKRVQATERDLLLYEDALLYYFYYQFYPRMLAATFRNEGTAKARWGFYAEFRQEWRDRFNIPEVTLPTGHQPAHIFACYYQVLRAFYHVFEQIVGASVPAARLRAAVWQSVFTHDIRRYRRSLFSRMSEFATLITGPSGSGKELVARSIAMSRYVPFDETKLTFQQDLDGLFFPINIAAVPGTLVESELFGHKRGAFTGAVDDKRGWLETCPPLGAVFLDEIGDLDSEIQVKMLRVIETRTFRALGESKAQVHRFEGKLIAATNKDLGAAIRKKKFREDLYYRLCSDQIATPSLRQQIDESPGVLRDLILFMSRRIAGVEATQLAEEACQWVEKNLGADYEWPGNYRELEQCIRNILIRKDYQPPQANAHTDRQDIFADAAKGCLTAAELLSRYCTLVYAMTASYEKTARRLGIDRRTVKAKIDEPLLARLRNAKPRPL